jgi:tetratricopeptide (TPR) repeat protein
MAKGICLLLLILLIWVSIAFAQSTAPDTPSQAVHHSAVPDYTEVRRLIQQGKFDEAIANLQQIQTGNPSAKGLDHELGVAYYKKGDYLRAVESLKKATGADAEDKEGVQLLGLAYYLSGQPAQAIPFLEKVQGWYPRANVDASYILGICYIQAKDYPHARQAFARMFDVGPDSAASYLFTARMLLRQEFDR